MGMVIAIYRSGYCGHVFVIFSGARCVYTFTYRVLLYNPIGICYSVLYLELRVCDPHLSNLNTDCLYHNVLEFLCFIGSWFSNQWLYIYIYIYTGRQCLLQNHTLTMLTLVLAWLVVSVASRIWHSQLK